MIFVFLLVLLACILSFIVTFFSTKWVIKEAPIRGFTGKDINKPDKREVAQLGGIAILAGFVAGAFTLMISDSRSQEIIPAILLSALLIGFLGIVDDVFNVRQSLRAFLPVAAAVPLSLFSLGHSVISIPFVGLVNFGILYYIIIVPGALTITSNAFNMLEGLNGLGTGMGIVMLSTLTAIGLKGTGPTHLAGLLALVTDFAFIAFLLFNKYPAKVFPGNIGTYLMGAIIGAIGIGGYMFTALAVLYLPYVVEFVLKARTKFKGISFGKLREDGTLYWDSYPNSLTHVIMKLGRFKEYQIVSIIWAIEILFGVVAFILQTTVITL